MWSGWKTYVVAAAMAIIAAYYFSQGDTARGVEFIMAALAAAGLRHAIQTGGAK